MNYLHELPPTINKADLLKATEATKAAYFDNDLSGEEEEKRGDPNRTEDARALNDSLVDDEVLAEPEIRGLWDKSGRGRGERERGEPLSKLVKEMKERAMESLKTSVVVKQVAAGREFQVREGGRESNTQQQTLHNMLRDGRTGWMNVPPPTPPPPQGKAFLSKPEEALFKDFVVGRVYRRRLQFTNVSYTVNHLKLLGVSDNLKNFLSVDFNPPGSMSAGLTCHMTVTFEPKVLQSAIVRRNKLRALIVDIILKDNLPTVLLSSCL